MSPASSPPPRKRTRHRLACEPCRRKKSKCPGEKPSCAFCTRLGQSCYYADESSSEYRGVNGVPNPMSPPIGRQEAEKARNAEERLQVLEAKLGQVLGVVSHLQSQSRDGSQVPVAVASQEQVSVNRGETSSFSTNTLPRWDIVVAVTEHYLIYCDCQPLPLFHKDTLLSTLKNRDPEVLLAILALTLRFYDDPACRASLEQLTRNYAEEARKIVMARITDGPIELSTLQTLCILSLVDFTNGNKPRASIHSSLAMNLAHCSGLTSESQLPMSEVMREERRRCFWSIFLLKRLHGADVGVLDFSGEENFPWYPETIGIAPSPQTSNLGDTVDLSRSGKTKDIGIVAYAIQLSEVWFKTTKYARRRATPGTIPPWSSESEYATVIAQTMDFETRMPYTHRFKPSGFATLSTASLQSNRSYWAPWLFVQFLYHTNLCLLNHPLILALRLRTFSKMMPEIFLQHTSDLISTHATWIVHLITTARSKAFTVSDPFLGHCAAIVATIFLHESFTADRAARDEHNAHFRTCFDFITALGAHWPHMTRLADKLRRLRDTVSASYPASYPNSTSNMNPQSSPPPLPSRGLLIDLGRFWEVLEYSAASEVTSEAGTLFGPSLYLRRRLSDAAGEMTATAALPSATRLEAAAGLAGLSAGASRGVGIEVERRRDEALLPTGETYVQRESYSSNGPGTAVFGDLVSGMVGTDMSSATEAFSYGSMAEPPYSNDELAVLANSFFNPRQDILGNVEDWWKTGNL